MGKKAEDLIADQTNEQKSGCPAVGAAPLPFAEIRLEDRSLLDAHLKKYGGNSCQHSFAAMYCTHDKYGDRFAFAEGWLFIHRSGLDDADSRCYLAPMGEGDFTRAVERLLADARFYGKKLRFESVAAPDALRIQDALPGCFDSSEQRDLAEYIYTYEKLSRLPGHRQASKRTDINHFWRTYGDDVRLVPLTRENIPAVLAYQETWLAGRGRDAHIDYLRHEDKVIRRALAAFDALECSGLVALYAERICGYVFGFALSDDCYDVFIEKGDREIRDIYRILNQEIVKRCCGGYAYINREEDLGVPGLRWAKESYEPYILMKKYIVTEARYE